MTLLCIGDSWTQGDNPSQKLNWDAKPNIPWYHIVPNFGEPNYPVDDRVLYKFYDSEVWPKTLGRILGCETYNAGRLGADNRRIVRSGINSIKYLQEKGCKDIFLIAGFTSFTRVPLYQVKGNKGILTHHQVRPSMKYFNQYFKKLQVLTDDFLLDVIGLQNFCEVNNVNYLFFNAFDTVDNIENSTLFSYLDKKHWVYKDPIEYTFKQFIVDKFRGNLGRGEWDDKSDYFVSNHPTDLSHKNWGEFLADYINTNSNDFNCS